MKKSYSIAFFFTLTISYIFFPAVAQISDLVCPIWGPNVNMVDETSAVIQYKMKNPNFPYNFTIHEILLNNLIPNTSYTYSLLLNSGNYTFRTAPTDGSPQAFSFGFYGDNRGPQQAIEVTETYYTIIDEMMKYQPNFIIEGGDLIEADGGAKPERREAQWDAFRKVRDGAQHEIPIYAAIGNHDDPQNVADITFEDVFAHWGNERYYSFDYGFCHFTILDSLENNYQILGEQIEWLKNDLAKSNAVYKFVISHYPYVSRYEPARGLLGFAELIGEPETATDFWEILENNSITAFLTSHDHLYDRILIGERNITQALVAGAGASLYIPSSRQIDTETGEPVLYRDKPAFAAYGFGYSILHVDWDNIRIDAYGLGNLSQRLDEGILVDSFEFPTPYKLTGAISVSNSHIPVTPIADDDLEITASLSGASSPVTVNIFYTKDNLYWENAPMVFDQDHYEYNISSLLDNSQVQYYIVANDSDNNQGLSDLQNIVIGSPSAQSDEEIYLGALLNLSGCIPYSQIPPPYTSTTTTTVWDDQTEPAAGFLFGSIIISVISMIIRKRKRS